MTRSASDLFVGYIAEYLYFVRLLCMKLCILTDISTVFPHLLSICKIKATVIEKGSYEIGTQIKKIKYHTINSCVISNNGCLSFRPAFSSFMHFMLSSISFPKISMVRHFLSEL